jgi:hypothetical protein
LSGLKSASESRFPRVCLHLIYSTRALTVDLFVAHLDEAAARQ